MYEFKTIAVIDDTEYSLGPVHYAYYKHKNIWKESASISNTQLLKVNEMLSKKAVEIIAKFKNKQSGTSGLFSTNGKELRYLNYRIARHHAVNSQILWDERNYTPEDKLVVTQVKRFLDA